MEREKKKKEGGRDGGRHMWRNDAIIVIDVCRGSGSILRFRLCSVFYLANQSVLTNVFFRLDVSLSPLTHHFLVAFGLVLEVD